VTKRRPEQTVIEGLSRKRRQFLLYLPLRNPVKRLEIGVGSDSFFRGIPPRTEQPLVYYGSSIVHGAYASRAGRVHPSLLGRMLVWPVVNLGFSGQAKMHPGMAQLLGEIDAKAFVIDPLPNMDPALIRERSLSFILALREARPTTPIILVEDFPVSGSWIFPGRMKIHREKWRLFSRLYNQLKSDGDRQLYYVKGQSLLGLDNEGAVDGIHPNDLGYQRLAEGLLPTLQRVFTKENRAKPVSTRG
jgi:hypothetical protein